MKKQIMALLVALLMTACVGGSMFAIGGAALFNKNGVQVSNSPAQAAQVSNASSSQQDQIAQLQSLVSQYQQREQQLQQELSQANAQVQQDQQMIQQVRLLLSALQQRGVISISNDGRIFIN